MKNYDIMMIGHISRDIMIDYLGNEDRLTGGPVVQSSAAAVRAGASVLVVTRAAAADLPAIESLKAGSVGSAGSAGAAGAAGGLEAAGADWLVLPSPVTTSIRNVYHTENQELRDVTLLSQAEPFDPEEIPENPVGIYHLAGLFRGEIPDTMIHVLAARAPVAVDAQGLLRCSEGGKLFFRDWEQKREYLPLITCFKVDAAEAEILTGESDREKAALQLHAWGAREVMLTHNTEVMVCREGEIFRAPFTNKTFLGRTGRGDTTFAAYLVRRKDHTVQEAVTFAAALCSIKMETPGPFDGTVEDVMERIRRDYS